VAMEKNLDFHSRTKHIDIGYHYVGSLLSIRGIALEDCDTTEQILDIFIKSFP